MSITTDESNEVVVRNNKDQLNKPKSAKKLGFGGLMRSGPSRSAPSKKNERKKKRHILESARKAAPSKSPTNSEIQGIDLNELEHDRQENLENRNKPDVSLERSEGDDIPGDFQEQSDLQNANSIWKRTKKRKRRAETSESESVEEIVPKDKRKSGKKRIRRESESAPEGDAIRSDKRSRKGKSRGRKEVRKTSIDTDRYNSSSDEGEIRRNRRSERERQRYSKERESTEDSGKPRSTSVGRRKQVSLRLSSKAQSTKRRLEEHLGELTKVDPLDYPLSKKEKQAIVDATSKTEEFFPSMHSIKQPIKYHRWGDRERDKQLYKTLNDIKQMYEMQMLLLHTIVNGDQDEACDICLQQVDLMMHRATSVNLERVGILTSPAVVEMSKHDEEEPILRGRHRKLISEKAKEDADIRTLTSRPSSQTGSESLRGWKPLRRGGGSRSFRGDSLGARYPPQSTKYKTGHYHPSTTRHQYKAGRYTSKGDSNKSRFTQRTDTSQPASVGSRGK
jgi:hypothetical protein